MLNSSEATTRALNVLPLQARAFAANSAYEVTLKNGESIVQAGKTLPGIMLLTKGVISVNRELKSGEDIVLCFARQYQWFLGDLVVGNHMPSYNCVAVGRANVIVWPRASVHEAYELCADLRQMICNSSIFVQQRMARELEVERSLTLPQRLARRLLELAELSGTPSNEIGIKLQAPVSHSLLASSLGVTRQRIHSQLREWSELGWLDSHYRDVVLHQPQALKTAAAYA
jgi:CRP/FNR family transcriptional regulator, cyclic AMP receptor protein